MGQISLGAIATRGFKRRTILGIVALAALLCGPIHDATAAQVLIDFGATSTPTTTDSLSRIWNNINAGNDLSGSPFTLQNTASADSGYRLTISNPSGVTNPVGFNGENGNGTTTPTGAALARGYPVSATRDSIYGNDVAFSVGIVQAVRLTLSNLNPNEVYSLAFFASRVGAGGDNREAEYFITGGNGSTSLFLNASENSGNIVELTGITPNGSNQIVIDIDEGPNNNNANGFFYLGVMEINSVAASPVPEPSTLAFVGGMLGVWALISHRQRRAANRD